MAYIKKINLLPLIALLLLTAGCQRNIPIINPPTTAGDTTGTLLDKTITITHHQGSLDSLVTQFTYNSSNKLTAVNEVRNFYDSTTGATFPDFYFTGFTRDALGRVTVLYTNPADTATGTRYTYVNSTSPLVAYEIANSYNNQYDSNAYHHDGQGLVTNIENYHIEHGIAAKKGFQQFTYGANNNITEIKVYGYSDEAGEHPDGLAFTYTYQYDNNPNPFFTGDDIMPQWLWADPYKMHNNPTLFNQASNALNPSNPLTTINIQSYTYRTDGLPLTRNVSTSLSQGTGGNSQSKTTYFYK